MSPRRKGYIFSYEKKRQARLLKKVLTALIVVIILAVAALAALTIYNSTIHIKLNKERTLEVNTPAVASQFIESIGNGTLIEDRDIDTSTVGKKDVTVKIRVGTDDRDYTFNVNVVDTQAPVIALGESELNLLQGTPLDVISKYEASDNSGEEVTITVEGEYNPDVTGVQPLKIVATDASGNTAEQEMNINVVAIQNPMPDGTFLTRTGHRAEVKGGVLYVDGILVVNKTFGLPENVNPGMDKNASAAFDTMIAAAAQEGIQLESVTEFRSYGDQGILFDYYAYDLGEGEDTLSTMKAGHSEHQSGMAMDVNSIDLAFAKTAEGIWLHNNCHKYGFIIRYPETKLAETGCEWEPFHVRYVGNELAAILYNGGDWITMEEYFGLPSKYL